MGLLEVNSINNTKTVTSSVATSSTASKVTNPLPLVNDTKKIENKGLTIEKTTQKTGYQKGESIDERLSRFYTKYKDATPEEKEKFLDKYITQYYSEIKGKSRSEQIQIQLADYKKLIANTKKGDSYEMLAKRINILEKENQVSAAKNLTVEQSNLELRKRGEIGVAKTIQNCDKGNQLELTQLVVNSKNAQAINIGASHASELDVKNQTPAVNIYKTADISKTDKIELGKIIINQYEDFDKTNQVAIHSIMSDKNYWDSTIIEYAASNIYKFDEANRADALKITEETGNEKAINSAKEALIEAEETEEQTAPTNSEKAPEKDIKTQIKEIEASNSINKEAQIKELVKNANPSQLLTLLSQNPSMTLILAALEQNPTGDVLSKIKGLTENMDEKDQKIVMEKMSNAFSFKVLASSMTLFGTKTQNIFIKECASKGNLKTINRMFLSASAKSTYDALVKTTVG